MLTFISLTTPMLEIGWAESRLLCRGWYQYIHGCRFGMLVLVLNLMLGICAFTNKKCREGKYNFRIRKRVLWRRPAAQTNALVVSRVGASISIYRIRTHYVYTVVGGKEKSVVPSPYYGTVYSFLHDASVISLPRFVLLSTGSWVRPASCFLFNSRSKFKKPIEKAADISSGAQGEKKERKNEMNEGKPSREVWTECCGQAFQVDTHHQLSRSFSDVFIIVDQVQ